ncbi:aminotransferase class III-fold pyridoxal phosphate-dependent enzyme [Planctomicrobium sp. SH661]|uniref:aminotransferase class III-fold pyridoxal phosphate-dependent enzyme n=1 Tax=Planctomicrobium sp. SH661 TaxID=3448124 RepID=UPI003F5B7FD6
MMTETELLERSLHSFIPQRTFDFHAHLYEPQSDTPALPPLALPGQTAVGFDAYLSSLKNWMGRSVPQAGLFFALPTKTLCLPSANRLILQELKQHPMSRGLLLIKPQDDPAKVSTQVASEGWAGFKVYHHYASRPDTFNAEIGEFIPEWAWETSHARGLAIMLHLVRERAVADPRNLEYIRSHCSRYPNTRLILAHAARGFCGYHTVEGIDSLRGLDNVYFDTSAICEAASFEAVLRVFGPTRLLFGTDFPVSEIVGRCISVGDGFHWLSSQQTGDPRTSFARPVRVGVESLLALRQACQTLRLKDRDVERIFSLNAMQLLSIEEQPTGPSAQETYRQAKALIPGGTQLLSKRPEMYAPDRWPSYYREARGCEVIDLEERRFTDFTTVGIGSCLLGYADSDVTDAVVRRVQLGSMCTLNSPEEVELAQTLVDLHPWAEQVRYCRTGGEAMSIAVRIARASTGRDCLAFCGYHGWSDWYLSANLPGRGDGRNEDRLGGHLLAGLNAAGVPAGLHTTALPFSYQRIDELHRHVKNMEGRIAAVVMEPTRSVPPAPGFLEDVRQICDDCGAALIFDEITTGWRLSLGGVHLKFGVRPDIAVFAKALGNGHPMGAVVGTAKFMQAAQESFISSTYWTEGVGPTAALATIQKMKSVDVPAHVERIGSVFLKRWNELGQQTGIATAATGHSALLSLTFSHPDAAAVGTLFTARMLDHGFLTGSGFYPTLTHTDLHLDAYFSAASQVFQELADAIAKNDVRERLGSPVRHGGFQRLT